jgi:hypothetical protein
LSSRIPKPLIVIAPMSTLANRAVGRSVTIDIADTAIDLGRHWKNALEQCLSEQRAHQSECPCSEECDHDPDSSVAIFTSISFD